MQLAARLWSMELTRSGKSLGLLWVQERRLGSFTKKRSLYRSTPVGRAFFCLSPPLLTLPIEAFPERMIELALQTAHVILLSKMLSLLVEHAYGLCLSECERQIGCQFQEFVT